MAAAMAHRGPDGEGVWHDDVAGLAFRRLAIIDLDERSNQPLHLGPWHLVFNGEIYDYRERRDELAQLGHAFVTEGDGEVLLHAWAEWGEAALDRVNGMFAFAIWHDERRELTLCARPVRREARLLVPRRRAARVRLRHPRAAAGRAAIGAPRDGALGPFLARGLMPPIDESLLRRRAPAAGRAPCCASTDGRVDVRRYWTPREVDVPHAYADAVARAARAARGLDPAAAALRRAGRDVAERRRRLVGRRRARRPARRRTPRGTRSPPASPATSATSGRTPRRSRAAAGRASSTTA